MPNLSKDITKAAQVIKAGLIVAFPTSTSYGLAADVTQGWALQRLRNLKQRPDTKTFTVFMPDDILPDFVELTLDEAKLIQNISNKSLTILVTPKPELEHLAQDGRIGLRLIDNPIMQSLADTAHGPLTATSANISGEDALYSPAAIAKTFPDVAADGTTYNLSLGLVLDGGTISPKPATSIIKVEGEKVLVLRTGEVTAEDCTQAIQA